MQKQKKVPQRKCIACQERDAKKGLIRIVKTKEGQIFLDPTGKANGRGAYICKDVRMSKKSNKKSKALNRAFKMEVPSDVYDNLLKELESYED